MKHLKVVSKRPAQAVDIPASAMLTFVIAVLNAFTPLLVVKEAEAET